MEICNERRLDHTKEQQQFIQLKGVDFCDTDYCYQVVIVIMQVDLYFVH